MRLRVVLLLLLLLAIAGPALAQGGVLNYGDNTIGTLSATAPLAFYTFSGSAGDVVTIQVIGITPGLDPAVSLNSPTQQQLANNDNDASSFGSTDARLSVALPQNAIFTVLVSSANGAGGDFLLRLSGHQAAPAAALSDTPTSVDVGAGGQPQVFTFEADPANALTLTVTGSPANFAFRVNVQISGGQLVAFLTGSGQLAVTLPPGSGTYTVEVSGVDPNVPGQVSASVGVPSAGSAAPPPPAQTEEAAPPPQTDQTNADVCSVGPLGGTVNIRSGPGTNFNVVAQLQPGGAHFEVVGVYNTWYLVNIPGDGQGWVRRDVVAGFGPCDSVPVVSPPDVPPPAQTEEVAPQSDQAASTNTPTATSTQSVQQQQEATPTSTFTPTQPAQQVQPTATYTYTPTYTPSPTPTVPAPTAPPDANFNTPLNIPLDSTASVTDFVSYPGGDREDRVRWDITGMNPNSSLSGGRARLILAVSCFGTGTQNVQFFTGGQTYSCGQAIVDQEVTYDSRTGQVTITAVAGENTYVQWVLTGTATRVN